ncbi:MAG: AMP-binding protein, partial [Gemmatimonadota bacterium]
LVAAADRAASWLSELGVQPGDVCAIVLPSDPLFFAVYMGVVFAGGLPSVLAYPNERLHPAKFQNGLRGMAAKSGLQWMVTDAALWERLASLVADSPIRIGLVDPELFERGGSSVPIQLPQVLPDQPCLLQHSSGTTGLQKGVTLSHRAILEHAIRYGRSIAVTASDGVASWLPLYHDMGLIAAFHLPFLYGIPVVQLDPFEWVLRPAELLQAVAHERSTLCWLPNFAFNLLADRTRDRDIPPGACETLRLVVSCSEPIRASSIRRLLTRLAPYGLRSGAVSASFAMAETTFAVTQTRPGEAVTTEQVSRSGLAQGIARPPADGEPVRECVSSGVPIDGCAVRITGPGSGVVPDGVVGAVEVTSVSLFEGYRNDPDRTGSAFRGAWFVTGDVGYLRDHELFVIGREKDLIIVGGKNIYPEDVEDALAKVEGVIPGRVVAFEMDDDALGTGRIAVVVETEEAGREARLGLRSRVVHVGAEFDLSISSVFIAPPRWLIKSSSGKLSRRENGARAVEQLEDPIWTTT